MDYKVTNSSNTEDFVLADGTRIPAKSSRVVDTYPAVTAEQAVNLTITEVSGEADNVLDAEDLTSPVRIGDSLTPLLTSSTSNALQAAVAEGAARGNQSAHLWAFMTSAEIADVVNRTALIDVSAAVQDALDSGYKHIVVPSGLYWCADASLNFPDWVCLEGAGYTPLIGGSGRITEFRFSKTSGAAITTNANPVVKNIWFSNTGGSYSDVTYTLSGTTARAVDVTENGTWEECGFSAWYECMRTGASTFYLRTNRLHFNRCTYGYRAVGGSSYTLEINSPHATRCEIFISGDGSSYPRNVKIFGGTIEDYSVVAEHFLDLSVYGTYFETTAPRTAVVAIAPGTNSSSVKLFGCLIYMNQTDRFVSASGGSNIAITSHGNTFAGVAPASSQCFYLPDSGSVHLSGDLFEEGHPSSAKYIDSIASASKFSIVHPVMPAGNTHAAYSGQTFVGSRGIFMSTITAAPASPYSGMLVCADGVTWDPLTRAYGRPYWVVWQGDRWRAAGGGT